MAEVDHLVYAVPDLAAACDEFEHALGVRPEIGGQHVGLGTWNALLALDWASGASCYLELLAVDPDQPAPEGPRPFGLDDDAGPRLVTFAIRPSAGETITDLAETLVEHRYSPGPVVPMSRETPAGELLAWHLTFPTLAEGGWVPFLIDWGATPNPAMTISGRVQLARLAGSRSVGVDRLLAALDIDDGCTSQLRDDPTGPPAGVSAQAVGVVRSSGLTATLIADGAIMHL